MKLTQHEIDEMIASGNTTTEAIKLEDRTLRVDRLCDHNIVEERVNPNGPMCSIVCKKCGREVL
jgi:hypothetical protein